MKTSLTLDEMAENIRLLKLEQKGLELLRLPIPEPEQRGWEDSSPEYASSSRVTHYLYKEKPQPELRYVNFYSGEGLWDSSWVPFKSAEEAFSSATTIGRETLAVAVPVEFPAGTFK